MLCTQQDKGTDEPTSAQTFIRRDWKFPRPCLDWGSNPRYRLSLDYTVQHVRPLGHGPCQPIPLPLLCCYFFPVSILSIDFGKGSATCNYWRCLVKTHWSRSYSIIITQFLIECSLNGKALQPVIPTHYAGHGFKSTSIERVHTILSAQAVINFVFVFLSAFLHRRGSVCDRF